MQYAQALERSHDLDQALSRYREAADLGVEAAEDDVRRLELGTAPEAAASFMHREDGSGYVSTIQAGVSVPLTTGLSLALIGGHETTDEGLAMQSGTLSRATGATRYARRGHQFMLSATAWDGDRVDATVGVGAAYRSAPGPVQGHLAVDANQPWVESASTLREGGTSDTLDGRLYSATSDRFVVSLTGQLRRLGLAPAMGMDESHAKQAFGSFGIDYIPLAAPGRKAQGEILADDMIWGTHLSSAWILAYRHYELRGDDPFSSRVSLVERSSVDEVSSIVRHVIDNTGRITAQVTGGLGYDRERGMRQWRAGGDLFLSATANARLSAGYHVASESRTGLVGQREAAWIGLHVDF